MNQRTAPFLLLPLALVGVVFSGYLSARLYTTNSCAFEEPCPTLNGIPACYFGLAFFLALVVVQLVALRGRVASGHALVASALLSGTGVTFALFASATDLQAWWLSDKGYSLGLPTCFYGAIWFGVVLAATVIMLGRPERRLRPAS